MAKVGFVSKDKKLGSIADQRKRIGPVDVELLPEDEDLLLSGHAVRDGDTLVIAHARALGRYKRGFALREDRLKWFASMNIAVQIGEDGYAELYDTAEKIARFHAAALAPTGIATPKQRKNPGRPNTYVEPEGEKRRMALEWYAGQLHTDDVGKLVGQMMGTKAVSRATMHSWWGPRPKCEGRLRKPRSDKKR